MASGEARRGGDDGQAPQEARRPENLAEGERGADDALDAAGDEHQGHYECRPLPAWLDVDGLFGHVLACVLLVEEDVDAVGRQRQDSERRVSIAASFVPPGTYVAPSAKTMNRTAR